MTHRARIGAFAILATAACSRAPPPAPPPAQPIRPLSATEPAGNAERITAFVRQQCVERLGNKTMFEEGLRGSGWSTREMLINAHSRRGEVGTYEFTGGFISASFDGRSRTCFFAVEMPLGAPFETLRDSLSRLGESPTPGPAPGTARWRWRDASGYDYLMDLTTGAGSDGRDIRIGVSAMGPAQ